jgi:hypothetical protein
VRRHLFHSHSRIVVGAGGAAVPNRIFGYDARSERIFDSVTANSTRFRPLRFAS